MATRIEMWKCKHTIDAFDTQEEAEFHDNQFELIQYINDHPILGDLGGCTIDGKEVIKWLKEAPRIFITLLPEEDID